MSEIDLHVHTSVSDGLHSPSEVVQMATQQGLRVISVTDHDNVDGVQPATEASQSTDLWVIPGVEISTEAGSAEVHILGYFIDAASQALREALERFRGARVQRAERILDKLRSMRIYLSWSKLLDIAGDGSVGRPHIARALQEAGYVASSQEAFDRYLGRGKAAYVPRQKMRPADALHLIQQAGGMPVLAHPWGVTAHIPKLAAEGLMGLETYYSSYTAEMSAYLVDTARLFDLICTGGSDFHGLALLPENRLGQIDFPQECFEAFLERARTLPNPPQVRSPHLP